MDPTPTLSSMWLSDSPEKKHLRYAVRWFENRFTIASALSRAANQKFIVPPPLPPLFSLPVAGGGVDGAVLTVSAALLLVTVPRELATTTV
jgi:hypothetical protein